MTDRAHALASRASVTWWTLTGAVAVYAVFVARSAFRVDGGLTFTLFDDAMISMRYARNLADGHGLVWNAGEGAVEGYTNFLWTLLMALPHLAGVDERFTSLVVIVVGGLLLLGAAVLAGGVVRRLTDDPRAPLVATALTAFSFPLVFWSLRGVEVALLAFVVTAGMLLALRLAARPSARDTWLLCGAAVAALLTRTDALVFLLVVAAWLGVVARVRRPAIHVLAATALTLAAHTAFRLAYYGEALPNTYHLKLGGVDLGVRVGRGAPALAEVAVDSLWAPLLLASFAVLAGRLGALVLPAGIVAGAAAYSVYVGGDAWEWMGYANRYLAPALPALFALVATGIAALARQRGARARNAAVTITAVSCGVAALAWLDPLEGVGAGTGLVGFFQQPLALPFALALAVVLVLPRARRVGAVVATAAVGVALVGNAHAVRVWVDDPGRVYFGPGSATLGMRLQEATTPGTTLAVHGAGAVTYFSERPTVDLLGKSDRTIAHQPPRAVFLPGHNKWDFEHSIVRLRPDVIVELWQPTDAELASLPRLGYEPFGRMWVLRGADVDRAAIARL